MQAITTKYYPATAHKGSRIKASVCDGHKIVDSVTIGYHSTDACPHETACAELLVKLNMRSGKWVGQHINWDTIAWVNVNASRKVNHVQQTVVD